MILKRIRLFAVAALLCAGAILRADTLPATAPMETLQDKLYSVFENNRDAIVKVYAQKSLPAVDKDGKEIEQLTLDVGSGFHRERRHCYDKRLCDALRKQAVGRVARRTARRQKRRVGSADNRVHIKNRRRF